MRISDELSGLFQRDLDRLRAELDAYTDEERLWSTPGGINNSAGNLIMHICGNLQHYIGAHLGDTGYVRNRDFEFAGRVTRDVLYQEIDAAKDAVSAYFTNASEQDWGEPYPREVSGHDMTKSQFLVHLYGHLNYHLGQVNYHRRLA